MRIGLELKNYRCFPDESPARLTIEPGLTALVGPNNSGKSTVLKFVYEFRQVFSQVRKGSFFRFGPGRPFMFDPPGVHDRMEPFSNLNSRAMVATISIEEAGVSHDTTGVPSATALRYVLDRDDFLIQAAVRVDGVFHDVVGRITGENVQNGQTVISGTNIPAFDAGPIVHVMETLQRAMYIGPFRNALNIGAKEDHFDITVGDAFVKKWAEYKTGTSVQNAEQAQLVESLVAEIFGFNSLQINASHDFRALQLVIDNRRQLLHEIGAGIAEFVIVLVNAAIRRPTLVLIDEPETHLHPSLQLKFLLRLASLSEFGIVFSTHSIGLARNAAESIYSLRLMKPGHATISPFSSGRDLGELLGEMSFSGYRELGFDSVLLVEGPTDVRVFQALLRKLRKDGQVVVIQLGGDSMINANREVELAEVCRLASKVDCIIDSERSSEDGEVRSERKEFASICRKLNINCHILKRRAIENYWSQRIVQRAFGDAATALDHYGRLPAPGTTWTKATSFVAAEHATWDELKDTDLGQFLSKQFGGN